MTTSQQTLNCHRVSLFQVDAINQARFFRFFFSVSAFFFLLRFHNASVFSLHPFILDLYLSISVSRLLVIRAAIWIRVSIRISIAKRATAPRRFYACQCVPDLARYQAIEQTHPLAPHPLTFFFLLCFSYPHPSSCFFSGGCGDSGNQQILHGVR